MRLKKRNKRAKFKARKNRLIRAGHILDEGTDHKMARVKKIRETMRQSRLNKICKGGK